MVETHINERTVRIILRIAGWGLLALRHGSLNLDVLVPFLAVNRAAVNLKTNVVVLDLYIRNMCGIAGFTAGPNSASAAATPPVRE